MGPLIPFGKLTRGFQLEVVSVLERVQPKITILHSSNFLQCRKNEAYNPLLALPARLVTLYYAIMQCISYREGSWCVQGLP